MIAYYQASQSAPDVAGAYPGDMYGPVTIPTAINYAVEGPSTAQPMQFAPLPTPIPLNAYVDTQTPNASVAVATGIAPNDGCASGLRWYEIVAAVALVAIALAAFRK